MNRFLTGLFLIFVMTTPLLLIGCSGGGGSAYYQHGMYRSYYGSGPGAIWRDRYVPVDPDWIGRQEAVQLPIEPDIGPGDLPDIGGDLEAVPFD